jgi:hypothetical protein
MNGTGIPLLLLLLHNIWIISHSFVASLQHLEVRTIFGPADMQAMFDHVSGTTKHVRKDFHYSSIKSLSQAKQIMGSLYVHDVSLILPRKIVQWYKIWLPFVARSFVHFIQSSIQGMLKLAIEIWCGSRPVEEQL